LVSDRFVLLAGTLSGALPSGLADAVRAAAVHGWALSLVRVSDGSEIPDDLPPSMESVPATDAWGRFRALFDAEPASIYLARPDGHVCARWRTLRHGDLSDALQTALGGVHSETVQ